MLALFLLFVVTPFVELFLLVRAGRFVGVGPTVGFVLAMGFLGAILAKSQGRRVIRDWQVAMSEGRVPEEGVLGGILVLLGALLLITPGILTDVAGLLLMVPAVRKPMARVLGAYLGRKLASGQLRVYTEEAGATGLAGSAPSGAESGPPRPSAPTEVGRAGYRPGEVIDTQGEEIE